MISTSSSERAVTVALRGPGLDRGKLAEEVARAEGVDAPPLLGDRDRAGEDEEELPADPAFPGQDFALGDADTLRQTGHLEELLPGATPELVHHVEQVDRGLTSKGRFHELIPSDPSIASARVASGRTTLNGAADNDVALPWRLAGEVSGHLTGEEPVPQLSF